MCINVDRFFPTRPDKKEQRLAWQWNIVKIEANYGEAEK